MKKIRNLSMVCVFFIAITGCSDNEWSAKESDVVSSKTIVVTDLEMDFHSAKIQKEVKPQKPQGYYPHYKEKEGYHYYVLTGTLKNLGKSTFNLKNIKVNGSNAKGLLPAKLVLINEIESYFWDEIGPNGSLQFYLFSIVKDDEKNPDYFHFYYDEDNKLEEEQVEFDYKLTYEIPKVFKK